MNDILLYSKDNLNVEIKKLSEKFMNIENIKPLKLSKYNIYYYDKSYIIPFELMNSIEKYLFKDKNNLIKPKIVFSKDNNIYIIDSFKIIFGNFIEQFIFIPEYIFSYNNITNFNKEKELIKSTPIEEYIQQRKCNKNNSDIQELKDRYYKILGQFITLSNNSKAKLNNNTKTDNIPINKKKEIRINTISNNSLDKRNI